MSEREGCFAPVFQPSSFIACIFLAIIYSAIILILIIPAIFSARYRCLVNQYRFRIRNCGRGNSDPNVPL